ncbi:MAG: hypothetical protein ACRDU4_06490, partial [Mycobacterium sp.]
RLGPLLVAAAGVAGVVAAFAAAGFWWLDGYGQVMIRYYQPGEYGLERPYGYWVWADLACLAVVLGPAGVAGLRRVVTTTQRPPRALALLCAAAALAAGRRPLRDGQGRGGTDLATVRGLAPGRDRPAPAAPGPLVADRPECARAAGQPPPAHHMVTAFSGDNPPAGTTQCVE